LKCLILRQIGRFLGMAHGLERGKMYIFKHYIFFEKIEKFIEMDGFDYFIYQ